jgi:hypothetical protein
VIIADTLFVLRVLRAELKFDTLPRLDSLPRDFRIVERLERMQDRNVYR